MCGSRLWLKLLHLVILQLGCCDFRDSHQTFPASLIAWDSEALTMAYEAQPLTTSLNSFPITFHAKLVQLPIEHGYLGG